MLSTIDDFWWRPRNSARVYFNIFKGIPLPLPKNQFDNAVRERKFTDGPYFETFDDDPENAHNHKLQAYGTLRDSVLVFTELSPDAPLLPGRSEENFELVKSTFQILQRFEFIRDGDDEICASCFNFKFEGHKDQCSVKSLLDRTKAFLESRGDRECNSEGT